MTEAVQRPWPLDFDRAVGAPRTVTVLVSGHGYQPHRAHHDDAGFDLYAHLQDELVIPPHSFVDVPHGISIELPAGYFGIITGRSSTLRKRGLLVTQGIIDTGYRGELFTGLWNLRDEEAVIRANERLAQLLIFPNVAAQAVMVSVEMLNPSDRGNGGFGSTGR